MSTYNTETIELASVAETRGTVRRRLVAAWQFTRHLGEMVLAMLVGMTALAVATGVLGEPPGYDRPLVEYGLMGVAMSIPMVAWMRFRGHTWADGGEMTAAMLLPMFALVLPVEFGIAGTNDHSLMMLTHVAMIAGMVALMLFRRDRYMHGAHHYRA